MVLKSDEIQAINRDKRLYFCEVSCKAVNLEFQAVWLGPSALKDVLYQVRM